MVAINGVPPSVVYAGAKAMAAGQYRSMVLKADGTVWATGENDHDKYIWDDKRSFVKVLSGQ